MVTHIRCEDCESVLLGFESPDLHPVGRETCPECGGREFRSLE